MTGQHLARLTTSPYRPARDNAESQIRKNQHMRCKVQKRSYLRDRMSKVGGDLSHSFRMNTNEIVGGSLSEGSTIPPQAAPAMLHPYPFFARLNDGLATIEGMWLRQSGYRRVKTGDKDDELAGSQSALARRN